MTPQDRGHEGLDVVEIQAQLERILHDPRFVRARRLQQFLRLIVSKYLAGDSADLKETLIGGLLFDRPNYDPIKDTVVRTTATRVRQKLADYYKTAGCSDPWLIELLPDSYIPRITRNTSEDPVWESAESPIATESTGSPAILRRIPKPTWAAMFAALLTGLVVVISLRMLSRMDAPTPASPEWGRLLVRATSENGTPSAIQLTHDVYAMTVSPDGRRLFAATQTLPAVSAVTLANGRVDEIRLPSDFSALALSPDGSRMYVATKVDGITVIDAATFRIISQIPTRGQVLGLAPTADGKKVFLAMSQKGLWRMLSSNGKLEQISDQSCPEHVEVGLGRKLYVSYQCGGPTGRSGHDAVEIYDSDTEQRLGTVSGPPLVGGGLALSLDGRTLIIDGADACKSPQYDHEGCISIPSNIIHFLRVSDRQFIKSLPLPVDVGPVHFLDSTHLVLGGNPVSVMDIRQYGPVERWDGWGHESMPFESAAIDRRRGKVFVALHQKRKILTFQAEKTTCFPMERGLLAFYSGDGVTANLEGGDALVAFGGAHYGPGRVGQAFILDGQSGYLVGPKTQRNSFGDRDSSFAAYAKFTDVEGEMVILDRTFPDSLVGTRLYKARDNRITFDYRAEAWSVHLASHSVVSRDRWYHVVVTKNDHEITLYLNGILEAQSAVPAVPIDLNSRTTVQLLFGASYDRRSFLRGKLDELLFYTRALTAREVQQLYQMRESGACRI